MKKFLLISIGFMMTLGSSFAQQVTLLDFETVKDVIIEPFDLSFPTSETTEFYVPNPDGEGSVGKIVKIMDPSNMWGYAFWGGINIYFGGDVVFSGTNDTVKVDFYAENAGRNDTILFKFQLFNRYGGVETIELDGYYTDANDKEVGKWKTLKYAIPDGTTGSYNQMVIFFGWTFVANGDVFYYDNVTVPGFSAYGKTDVTFNITDKFNNATNVKLFIDGNEETLAKTSNVYSSTKSLDAYTILGGKPVGIHEIVYSHMANGVEVRDTSTLIVGNSSGNQEVIKLIIVETPEDGTAKAISVGDTPPIIDGNIDAVWSNARTHTLQKRSWWGSPTGLYTTWKVMWDIDNVYLLYVVEDETPFGTNVVNVYENDCIETFFDMNQSAKNGYDSDDWQIRTVRGSDSWTGSANVTVSWANDVSRAQVSMADNKGYIIEMAIPWLSLSPTFLPLAGKQFNYDATAADVTAEGGPRIYRESWQTDDDNAYFDTSKFGTITLSSETNEGGTTSVVDASIANVSVYPNPASEQLLIRSDAQITAYSIYDVTGRVIKSNSSIRDHSVVLNVSDLKEGVYLLTITDLSDNVSIQKIQIIR